jgi:hypothetical protein
MTLPAPNLRTREVLARWIASKEKNAKGPWRVKATSGDRTLDTFAPDPGEGGEEFSARLLGELEEDAEMVGEKVLYVLRFAVRDPEVPPEAGEAAWREEGTKSVKIAPLSVEAFDGEHAERSLLGQAHRMLEATQRFALNASTEALRHSEQQAVLAYQREQHFRDREWDDRLLIRGTLEHRAELESKRVEAAAEREVMLAAISLAGGLLPGALSAFARARSGAAAGPRAPEHELLKQFLGALRQEQYMHLAGALSDAQRIPLLQIVQGEIEPELVPAAVRTLLAEITEEQFNAIWGLLDEGAQRQKFQELFAMRKHVFDLRLKVGDLLGDSPKLKEGFDEAEGAPEKG